MNNKNLEIMTAMIEEINNWISEDVDGTWEKITDFREVTEDDNYEETKKNLLAELKKIADAVKENGGACYLDNNNTYEVTGLIVHHNGCIGALIDAPVYCVNEIFVNKSGKPCISGWALDNINRGETFKDLFDPEKRYFPAYMFYDVQSGNYFIRNTLPMLEVYQRTLDFADDIAPIAANNASVRIGGRFYGMSYREKLGAMKKVIEERKAAKEARETAQKVS